MPKFVEVTIRYPREDTEVPLSEEQRHWEEGGIDIPTLRDGDGECTIKVAEVEA